MEKNDKTIYFDAAATCPVCDGARAAFLSALEDFGNPSSPHPAGARAREILEKSRKKIAEYLGCDKDCFVFTSCGTESNNIALRSYARRAGASKGRIIISASEHPSVAKVAAELEKEGFELVKIPCPNGVFDLEAFKEALNGKEKIVSVMHANNQTGALYDTENIRRAMTRAGSQAFLHVDAVQSLGKITDSQRRALMRSADSVSFSAHKIGGVIGIGGLCISQRVRMFPLTFGGEQERSVRPGTENYPGAAAFAAALEDISSAEAQNRVKTVRERLKKELCGVAKIYEPENHINEILLISLEGYRSETAVNYCAKRNICLSASSACSTKVKQNNVLYDYGLRDKELAGALRIGISRFNTEEDAVMLADCLKKFKTEVKNV